MTCSALVVLGRPEELALGAAIYRLEAFINIGLGADACNSQASKQIYLAKGRPCDNPLIVHIADIFSLEKLTKEIPNMLKFHLLQLLPFSVDTLL